MLLLITKYNLAPKWVHLIIFLLFYYACIKLSLIHNNFFYAECGPGNRDAYIGNALAKLQKDVTGLNSRVKEIEGTLGISDDRIAEPKISPSSDQGVKEADFAATAPFNLNDEIAAAPNFDDLLTRVKTIENSLKEISTTSTFVETKQILQNYYPPETKQPGAGGSTVNCCNNCCSNLTQCCDKFTANISKCFGFGS